MGMFDAGNIENYIPLDKSTDEFSYNRVSGIAIFKDSTIGKDLYLSETWQQYIGATPTTPASEDFIFIPEVKGTYNGGEFETEEGYGNAEKSVIGGEHTLEVTGVFNPKNIPFYESLITSSSVGMAFITGTKQGDLQVIQNVGVSVVPKTEVTETRKNHRKFMLTISFSYIGFPPIVDVSQEVKNLFF